MWLKLGILVAAFVSCCSWLRDTEALAQVARQDTARTLNSLPDSLDDLRAQTEYKTWEPVRFFSRTLRHYRQLRINSDWNVIVSETGKSEGTIEVVEVIRLPVNTEAGGVSFAIYDPTSGKRLENYPSGIMFDIEGTVEHSRERAPGVCVWCHHESKPLLAVIPWNESLQNEIERVRRSGVGIRQSLVDPLPNDAQATKAIEKINKQMEQQYPALYTDMRQWLKQYER